MIPSLKPCPFCGSAKAPLAGRTNPRAWWVTCEPEDGGCGAEGPSRHTRREASAVWNRRNRCQQQVVVVERPRERTYSERYPEDAEFRSALGV